MKRVFQHPPATTTGKQYWRSVGELSDTPEFREWLEREFPAGADQLDGDEYSRRGFLKVMGASMALAGFGLSSCRRPEMHLVPFSKSVEWAIPGKALYYATAMPRRDGALPVVATNIDGRPIKIEGNPLHPASGGATDAYAQASILDLYDPARAKRYLERGKTVDRAAFEAYLDKLRPELAANGGAGLAFLVEETHSPTRERLRAELEKQFPKMRWVVYEPLGSEAQNFATQISFGDNLKVIPRYDQADVILAIDSDFVSCNSDGGVLAARQFSARRRVTSAKDTMNRLYAVENHFTLTGAMADHRLRCPASQIPAFTAAVARKLATTTKDAGLFSVLATLPPATGAMNFDDRWITELVNDLAAKPGASLVVAGGNQPVVVQVLTLAMNTALKNFGTTVVLRESPRNPKTNSILQLAAEAKAGRVKQLFILGGDPVYNAPADLDWPELQKKIPEVVRVGFYEDATSAASHWHIPGTHYLESWGDALTAAGDYLAIQPMILPLYGGMSDLDLIWAVLGRPRAEERELVRDTFRATAPPGDFETAWNRFLHDGFAAHVTPRDRPPVLNANAAGTIAQTLWSTAPAPTPDSPEIVLVGSTSMDDGRYINNGWLQEMPDPITKLTWDNAALMSPAYAKHLGVADGDLIRIAVSAPSSDPKKPGATRELVIAVLVAPGHADNSITIPLGYGRKQTGPVGEECGFNGYLLRTSSNPHFIAAEGKAIGAVKVTKAGGNYQLATTQEHFSIEGRSLVREATIEHYRGDEDFAPKMGLEGDAPPEHVSIYHHPPLRALQQWGMTVDLNTCTGCSACVIACQSENNVPIVGKLQVSHGRSMHWLRLDRYYASAKPFNEDRGEWPEDPELVHEPMMCQHCENAPCETVCPVNATVHSEDGLNVMAYNRCIGTRYCANNCPFKVRRFNFFDYNQRPIGKTKIAGVSVFQEYLGPLTEKGAPDTVKMQKNPNVTVRMRGVMEKCTYCVQRIQEAKIATHAAAGESANIRIARDSFTTACAQACPSEAIVFGDISDPESRVSKIKQQNRNYRLLEYLNVNTRTSYLARIRNPNPKMPDAGKIAVASLGHEEKHGEHPEKHNFEQHDRGTLNPEGER